ncbi:DUF3866 family protein [Blastococcus sp. MG754426]|uniref:DUF3866 family protein n=1 Tax=unclassified Blastococcus TaxID=2619396 RepID=UPI001EF0B87E|nr:MULTISPECIES: DUF3866 family protein [unclassified Blastococcus]MCF6508856.1 DUF3866 family protein [Blastococcus sp. MG754426]MCF6512322.1 DUF3866 family protein [Blastococcus sp. MG754427]MCF6734178.1 DUF3866 family protein [Blastococcus sp. KM273129]
MTSAAPPAPASRIRWRRGRVTATGRSWRDALELTAEVAGEGELRALAYPSLVGVPEVGDDVLLNTTALARGLGTGGYALVVAVPDRLPPDPEGPGHLVKARYTPLQVMVQGVDEQETEHHATIADAEDLDGMPVVVADLHSALPAVLIGMLATDPDLKVAYVMTDGGALPAAFSRTVGALKNSLAGVVTVGQAFGGDLEAVTLHTGLLAARHVLGADLAIVTQGPGNLGTGTPWGFSGVAAGEACNAVSVLGGVPVGALRISDADPRPRHRGVSHHSLTAFGRVALGGVTLVAPRGLSSELGGQVDEDLASQPERNTVVWVDTDGLETALGLSPVPLSTMGRGYPEERAYFLAAAAAGRYAALQVPVDLETAPAAVETGGTAPGE